MGEIGEEGRKANHTKEVARLIRQQRKDGDRAYGIGLTKRWVDFEKKSGHGHRARMLADSLLLLYLPDVVAQESLSDSSAVMIVGNHIRKTLKSTN